MRGVRGDSIRGQLGSQIQVIANNLHNASMALARSAERDVQYMGPARVASELLEIYETANTGGLAVIARMSPAEAVFEDLQDIMSATRTCAEYISRGKEPIDLTHLGPAYRPAYGTVAEVNRQMEDKG